MCLACEGVHTLMPGSPSALTSIPFPLAPSLLALWSSSWCKSLSSSMTSGCSLHAAFLFPKSHTSSELCPKLCLLHGFL